jgi:glycosyltransferase involved in cell wall biosynthesis
MRDQWSLSERVHESVASPLWFWLARRYERAAIEQAVLVVANTEAAREAMASAYPGARARFITVMNGSDDEPLPRVESGHRFTLAYAGTIYRERHPRSLFRAVARVRSELGLTPADLGIEFMGGDVPGQHSLGEMARNEGIAEFLVARPMGPRAAALECLARASMLVTFPGWDSITIPAKIFECVRFDAWLLALADPGSATDRLLRGSGVDLVAPDDLPAIAAAIRRRYEEHRRGVRPSRPVSDDRFSRRRQAGILLDAIAEIVPASASRTARISGVIHQPHVMPVAGSRSPSRGREEG